MTTTINMTTDRTHDPTSGDRHRTTPAGPARAIAIVGGILLALGLTSFLVFGVMYRVPSILVMAVGGMTAVFAVANMAHTARRQELADAFERLGLNTLFVRTKADRAAAYELWEPFAFLKRLRTGNRGLTWIAWSERNDLTPDGRVTHLRMLEHRYLVQAGHASIAKYHTAAGVVVPTGWPDLQIEPAGMLSRGRGLSFGHTDFDRKFTVTCGDASFAREMLNESVRTWLLDTANRGERWRISSSASGTVLCCMWPKMVQAPKLTELASRPIELAERMDEALFNDRWRGLKTTTSPAYTDYGE